MLISKETTLQVFDNIPTINGLCLEPVIALRDVKEIIKAVPEVDAVPLDNLCEFLEKATQPCILLAIGCPYDESNCEECDSCNAWKATLTKWMEGQNASPQ